MTRRMIGSAGMAGRLVLGLAVTALAAALAVPTALASPESDAADAINRAWEAAGGAGSVIGSQDGDIYQVGSGYGRKFTDGAIFFTPATGAHLIYGAILNKYQSLGGPADSDLGFPTIDEVPGLVGPESRVSTFSASDKPAIFWTADTGARAVRGAINAAWDKLGGSAGTLGVPTEDERYDGDLVSQKFTGGELSWNSATKAFTTVPAELADRLAGLEVPLDPTTLINQAWRATGGLGGPLGARQGSQSPIADNGAAQGYAGGKIFYTPDTGAHAVTGAILSKYESLGGPSSDLGLPIGAENDGGVPNSRVSAFSATDKPVIFWTPDAGAIVVRGAINAAWDKLGGATGSLGVPTGEQVVKGDVATQKFTGGEVSWNRATKEFSTNPPGLAAELSGLKLPDGVGQTPAGGSDGSRGGLGWWWLAIAVPVLLLLGLLAAWARRRSAADDFGYADELDSDEDAIDTAPTRIPTEAELSEFGGPSAATDDDWGGESALGRHSAGSVSDPASGWQLGLGDFDAPRRRHAADESDSGGGYGTGSAAGSVFERFDDAIEINTGQEPAPVSAQGAGLREEPSLPPIHLPLSDPFQAPEGYSIKANTHSGLYYTPESVLYDQTVPEVWFASEEVAEANGFVRAPE